MAARPALVLAALLLLLFGPFLDKPLHVDDPPFVWAAQWIEHHPLDFYGFGANWYGRELPMHAMNHNPPAMAYFLAVVGAVLGWSEIVLHGSVLLVIFAATLGIHRLARLWQAPPLLSTPLAIATPVFLLSGASLMCDGLLLAFWIWALVAWERALAAEAPNPRIAVYALAGLLAGLAILTKYTALFLLPVMLTMGLLRRRRLGLWLLALLVPVASTGLYELVSWTLYGHGPLLSASAYAASNSRQFPGGWGTRLVASLAFLGGGLLPATLLLPVLCSRRVLLAAGLLPFALTLGLLSSMPQLGLTELRVGGDVRWGLVAQIAFLVAGGVCLLAAIAWEVGRQRDLVAATLAVWIGCGLLFLTVFNWTVNGRSLLPTVPAVILLLARRLEPTRDWRRLAIPVAAALVLGVMVMVADYQLAQTGQRAARDIVHRHGKAGRQLWFEGHWGFQHYMQTLGARPVDFTRPALEPEDLLVVPLGGNNLFWPKGGGVSLIDGWSATAFPWLATMQPGSGACFYAADCGPLPFAFGKIEPESYAILRVLRPLRF